MGDDLGVEGVHGEVNEGAQDEDSTYEFKGPEASEYEDGADAEACDVCFD